MTPPSDPVNLVAAAALELRVAGEKFVGLCRELNGIWSDHVEVQHAVNKLRRRGCVIEAIARERGYKLVAWRPKWHRQRRSSNAT